MLPFALAGAWKYRTFIRRGPLLTYVLVTVVFYVLWFFSGSPQKVRFLLPVYPLALIALSVAAIRYASQAFARRPLVAAVAIGIVIQLGGHALYSLKSVQYLLGNETREQFLVRTIADYQPVSWINANLTGTDRLLMRYRNYLYYLDVPYYYAHPQLQAQINLLPNASDPGAFVRQLRALDITHLLLPVSVGSPVSSLRKLSNKAVAAGCLVHVKSFSARSFSSRTLPSLNEKRSNFGLYHLVDKGCVYS